jgi:hypothetical protein
MIPFDLARFDDANSSISISTQIDQVGKEYLSRSGLAGEGAAILLARLYSRCSSLHSFVLATQAAHLGKTHLKSSLLSSNTRSKSFITMNLDQPYVDRLIEYVLTSLNIDIGCKHPSCCCGSYEEYE